MKREQFRVPLNNMKLRNLIFPRLKKVLRAQSEMASLVHINKAHSPAHSFYDIENVGFLLFKVNYLKTLYVDVLCEFVR